MMLCSSGQYLDLHVVQFKFLTFGEIDHCLLSITLVPNLGNERA
jgi:hypothetical protein